MQYYSILDESEGTFVEKKSKFIGYIKRVTSEEEALSVIEEKKKFFNDATHNTYAYIIGEKKEIQRYSDDKEPSGTAGVPMLEVLKKEDLTNVVTVVTRYFGGTLLGAGGLVRAYTKGVVEAINSGTKVLMKTMKRMSFTYDYTAHGAITNFILTNGYIILDEEYLDRVKIVIDVDFSDQNILENMKNLTSGAVITETLCEVLLPTVDGKIIYGGKNDKDR